MCPQELLVLFVIHQSLQTNKYTQTVPHEHTHTHLASNIELYRPMKTHKHTPRHAHTHIHTHTYMYIHTYTHTCILHQTYIQTHDYVHTLDEKQHTNEWKQRPSQNYKIANISQALLIHHWSDDFVRKCSEVITFLHAYCNTSVQALASFHKTQVKIFISLYKADIINLYAIINTLNHSHTLSIQ